MSPRPRATGPQRSEPGKPPLSRELIAKTALAILDSEGIRGLSMRAIADKLDTGPASLYAHVSGKDDLLDLVYDEVMLEYEVPDPDPENWRRQLVDFMRQQRRVLGSHRDIARIGMGRIPIGPNAVPVIDRMLGILRQTGWSDRVIGLAPDIMSLYVTAIALEEATFDMAEQEQLGAAMVEATAGFENIAALARALTEPTGDDRFEFGIEVILRGLESLAKDDEAS